MLSSTMLTSTVQPNIACERLSKCHIGMRSCCSWNVDNLCNCRASKPCNLSMIRHHVPQSHCVALRLEWLTGSSTVTQLSVGHCTAIYWKSSKLEGRTVSCLSSGINGRHCLGSDASAMTSWIAPIGRANCNLVIDVGVPYHYLAVAKQRSIK